MATTFVETGQVEQDLGAQFRALRLARGLDQVTVAERANVSVTTVRNLESGRGSTLATAIKVARVLGRLDAWALSLYPQQPLSPMEMLRAQQGRRTPQRAPRRRKPKPKPESGAGSSAAGERPDPTPRAG